MNATLLPIRIVFIALCAAAGWLLCYTIGDWDGFRVRASFIGLSLGVLVVLVDLMLKGFSLRGLSALTFGLGTGLLVAYMISVSPLLEVPVLPGRNPDGRWVAWATEREGGSRAFGTSCGHFYDNWKSDDFRKLMLNAIAWTAKLDPPEGGVESVYVERDQIKEALGLPAK
jgi:hypothetical protein